MGFDKDSGGGANLDNSEPPFLGSFVYEDLHKLGFIEVNHAKKNNLTEPVLGIFSNWEDIDEDERNALDRILRLASTFLRSSASVQFIHNVMYGEREYLKEESISANCEIHELKPPPCYTQEIFDQFMEGLDDLQGLATWNFADLPEGTAAETLPDLAEPRIFQGSMLDWKAGYCPNITIGTKVFKILNELHARTPPTRDFARHEVSMCNHKLRLQFWIAITLCHELIHAINHAISDNREPFYGNQNYAELGYAWENAVFGGRVLAPRRFDGHFPFTMVKWPSLALTPPDDSDETARGYAKGSATYYYVPMDHMTCIQQQETWDAYGSPDKAPLDALHIPKLVGVQLHEPLQEIVDPHWRRSVSSEGRRPGMGRYARVWRAAHLKKLVLHSDTTTTTTTVESSRPSPLLGRTLTSPDSVTCAYRGCAYRKGTKVVIDAVERFMRYLDKEEMR